MGLLTSQTHHESQRAPEIAHTVATSLSRRIGHGMAREDISCIVTKKEKNCAHETGGDVLLSFRIFILNVLKVR